MPVDNAYIAYKMCYDTRMKRRFVIIRVLETTRARLKAKAARKRKSLYEVVDDAEKLLKV
jgi:hypothetical protein